MKNSQKRNLEYLKKYKIEKNRVGNWTIKTISDDEKILMKYRYPSIKFSFSNKLVNDENVIYTNKTTLKVERACSEYAMERLIAGLSPFAQIYNKSFELYLSNIDRIDESLFSINILDNGMKESSSLIITKKGKMSDLFDFVALKQDYQKCGINVNVEKYQHLDIYSFYEILKTDELYEDVITSKCLIDLSMGIPIENTISKLYECELDDLKISSKYFMKKRTKIKQPTDSLKNEHGVIMYCASDINIKFIFNNGVALRRFTYPKVNYTFSNTMVNNDNQYFCNGFSIDGLDLSNDALYKRVIFGLKPMCCITEKSKEKIDIYIEKLDLNKFSYTYSTIYMQSSQEPCYNLIIARKGKIGELFDLDALGEDYFESKILINTEMFEDKTIKDLFPGFISHEIDLSDNLWLTDLLLGYPVENTISKYYEKYVNY